MGCHWKVIVYAIKIGLGSFEIYIVALYQLKVNGKKCKLELVDIQNFTYPVVMKNSSINKLL